MVELLYQPSLRSKLGVLLASARMRLITISRYRGQLALDLVMPIVFAAMPILLGRATGGAAAADNFLRNTGTANYVAYMLIGSSAFTIVTYAFWHTGYWVRWEQETGTLEAIYLAPTNKLWLVAGGALILKLKQANAIVNLMQWGVTLLMGVFFPVAVFPPMARVLAWLFPPTWMVNGVRSALLGVGFFFGRWYRDMAVLWAFMLIAPLLGAWVFARVERNIRRNAGMGEY